MPDSRPPRSGKRLTPKDQWYRVLDDNEGFQRLLSNLGAVITETDPEGNITYVSRTVEEAVGLRREDLIGQFEASQIHPDDFREIRARQAQPIESVGRQPLRYRAKGPGGEWRWIETAGSTRFVGDDGGVYGVSFSRDVTELLRAEERMRETADRYQLVLQANDFVLVECDLSGVVRFVSDSSERVLGFTPTEMMKHEPFELLHVEDRPRLEEQFRRAIESGKPTALDGYRVRHRDGRWRWFTSTGVGFNHPTGEQRFLSVTRDVTESVEKQREQADLRERSEQAKRLESLGLMAGGIAHDFNNLLTPILGQASLVLADLPEDSPLRGGLERIQRAARRASGLTQQMMAYAGADEVEAEPVRLSDFVESTCRLLDGQLGASVLFSLELAPELPLITADPGQLTQVVMNLVTNASEALKDGEGAIVVRTGCATYSERVESPFLEETLEPGRYVFVEVEDSGCGMDAVTRARMFDPFFTTKFTGRGLGLSSVLGILRAHGGTVELETELGQGTRFRVLFEASTDLVATASETRDAQESISADRPTILVIDDDEGARHVVSGCLERVGMKVLEAADGPSGVALFEAHRSDIRAVLLDRVMPLVSGEETFERLRAADIEAPVLLMSGFSEKGDAEKFVRWGAAGIIKKPFLPEDLCARVQSLLGQD